MTLQEIRNCSNLSELVLAICFVADNLEKLTYGEFCAYKGTIQDTARKLNVPLSKINEIAEAYQVFGKYKVDEILACND